MFLKSKFFRAAAALGLIFCFGAFVLADTIRLKDGSVIKGKIVGFRDGQFVVAIGDGARARQMTFFADEVEAIEFDATSVPVKISNPVGDATTNRPANNPSANTNSAPNSNVIIVGKGDANKAGTDPTPGYTNSLPVNSGTNTITAGNNQPPANTNKSVTEPKSTDKRDVVAVPVSKSIQLSVKVLADNTANGWTNSGWVVKKGQKIRISGRGQVNLGSGNFAKAEGIKSLADKDKLMAGEATGALIAVVGDNNNDFIFIGATREFVADRDGMLFLGINEGNLNDNSGAFDVTIEIEPGQNL